MTSIDSIRAAVDVGLATEQGDIDIADDMLKSAAFMVALATAAIYYMLSELSRSTQLQPLPTAQVGTYLAGVFFFATSIVLAARVHALHTRFRALCRNMIVARKLLLAELIEKSADVEAVSKESAVPLWALVTSGGITDLIASPAAATFPHTQSQQVVARGALDSVHRWQRLLVLLGLAMVIAGSTYLHVLRVAA